MILTTKARLNLLRHVRPFAPARPRWRRIRRAGPAPAASESGAGRRVLVATGTGSNWQMSGFESVLAAALGLRGAEVDVLLCDGVLPACQECDVRLLSQADLMARGPARLCRTCFAPAQAMFRDAGAEVLRYSDYLAQDDDREIAAFVAACPDPADPGLTWRGVPVGEHARAGALRFLGLGTLSGEPLGQEIARRYLSAALRATAVMDRLLATRRYDVAVFHHGIYVPQGPVGDVCRHRGVRVVNWNLAYRDKTFLFSHDDSYHRTMIAEPEAAWAAVPFGPAEEARIMGYLESRRTGGNDWISFQRGGGSGNAALARVGLDPGKPTIGMLTNVMWDAQLHFRTNAFASMVDWVRFTIAHFADRPGLQLMIRVHPAEVLGSVPSRQKIADEIARDWPTLPPNIRVVGPDDPENTYDLMRACDSVLVYGTKMAIELPCWGLPVIVAGEAWARGNGYTTDVTSPEDYATALAALPRGAPLDPDLVRRARHYAHHLFFRRMIPVAFAERNRRLTPVAYRIERLDQIAEGADPGLDTICRGILDNTPFEFDDGGAA